MIEGTPQIDSKIERKLDSNEAVVEEKGMLERFKGKAKKVANAMMLVSALSAGPGVVSEVYAQEKTGTGVEDVNKTHEDMKIDETKLTESSKWSKTMLDSIKADLKEIESDEDANVLAREISRIAGEYYVPKTGNLKEGAYGTKTREYTQDDYKYLYKNVGEAMKILTDLNKKHPIHGYENIMDQFDILSKHLKSQTTYAARKNREGLKNLEEYIKNR